MTKMKALCLFLAAALSGGLVSAQTLSASDAYQLKNMLRLAHEVVKKNYYDPAFHGVDLDARFKEYDAKLKTAASLNAGVAMIAAFLDALKDSHTFFAPPSRPYKLDYGYRLGLIGDRTFITRVRPGTDAEAKVRAGDQLLTLNGNAVTRDNFLSMQYFLNTLSPQGQTKLVIRDTSGPDREVTINTKTIPGRKQWDISSGAGSSDFQDLIRAEEAADHFVRQQFVEQGDVMIWKMPTFAVENAEVDKMLAIARKHSGLILDLRGNPGGYVDTLRRVVGAMFERDITIGTRVTRKGKSAVVAKARGAGSLYGGKLTVLVDSASGSAAEVFARVVQLEKRGTVLGDRSAGAVMESLFHQDAIAVSDQSIVFFGFSVTEADLLMTDGKSLEHTGVVPDEGALPSAEDLKLGRDPVLSRAAAMFGLTLDPVAAGKLFPFEWKPLTAAGGS
jgi:C-terminal processing protease CtpA/Prc